MLSALTIAGSDSGGGAGIQADMKTFSALGCFSASVITAITAQNTRGICDISLVPLESIEMQLNAVFDDMSFHAIKIGMLFDAERIHLIEKHISSRTPIVLDPVMVSKNGQRLLEENALQALKQLFSKVTLITPNVSEASLLVNFPIETRADAEAAGLELLRYGSSAVLIKGGHLIEHPGHDCLVMKDSKQAVWLDAPFIKTHNTHGTGCTYSSAIAAGLAKGYLLIESVVLAKQYVHAAITAAKKVSFGRGNGPVHHFHKFWNINMQGDF